VSRRRRSVCGVSWRQCFVRTTAGVPVQLNDSEAFNGNRRLTRDEVLEDCPRPRGRLEDKKSWPWPWPRKPVAWPRRPVALALASKTSGFGLGLGLGLGLVHAVLEPIPAAYGRMSQSVERCTFLTWFDLTPGSPGFCPDRKNRDIVWKSILLKPEVS